MEKIAELFAELSFKIDRTNLHRFERQLKGMQRQVNNLGDSLNRTSKRMQSNQKDYLRKTKHLYEQQKNELLAMRREYQGVNREYKAGNRSLEDRTRELQRINRQYREQQVLVRNTERSMARGFMAQSLMGRGAAASAAGGIAGEAAGGGGHPMVYAPGRKGGKSKFPDPDKDFVGHMDAMDRYSGSADQKIDAVRDKIGVPRAGLALGAGAGVAGMGAIAGPAIAAAVGGGAAFASNEAYQRLESLASGFTALEGSADKAGEQMARLANMADFYGQPFMEVANGFKSLANSLRGTPIEDEVNKIHKALVEYSTALGVDAQTMGRIQLAIAQIGSAGRVQGDELNQLAEAGISRTMLADAMGITMKEFMERQQSQQGILAENILPALANLMIKRANEGGALEKRRSSTQAHQARMANQAMMVNAVANVSGISKFFNELYQGLANMLESATPLFEEIGEGFKAMAPGARQTVEGFGSLLGSLGNLLDAFDDEDVDVAKTKSVFKTLADWINNLAIGVETLQDPKTAISDKLNAALNLFTDTIISILEFSANQAIKTLNRISDIANIVLPKSIEFGKLDAADFSGTKDKLKEVDKSIQENAERAQKMQYPPNHPMYRGGGNSTTNITQNISPTIHIDGAKDPDGILGTIEHHLSNMMRNASSADPIMEK